MGKKARKTRWRTLSISGTQSDNESQNGEVSKAHRYSLHNPRASAPWHHQQQQNGHAHQSSRFHSSHSTPTRHHNGYYSSKYETSKSTRSSSTASDNKITFNEDEYTRITTPRQDVLFKKGYLSKPKPYLQQHHQQQQQLTSTGNSTGDGTPDHQSADGAELGDYEYEHTSPFIFPNGFIDQNGICYVNGVHGYEPYPQMVMYNPAVCYPPPYVNHRVKRYSTDSMTESMSPNNECADAQSSSAGPDFNPVFGFVYPDGIDGTFVPYNHLPTETLVDEEAPANNGGAATAEAQADERHASEHTTERRAKKKRRRRKESRPRNEHSDGEEYTTEDEAAATTVATDTKQEEKQQNPEQSGQDVVLGEQQQGEEGAPFNTEPLTNGHADDTNQPDVMTTDKQTDLTVTAVSIAHEIDIVARSDSQDVASDNSAPAADDATHNEQTKDTDPKTDAQGTAASNTTKYRVDAEEFVPRAYRAVPMPSFIPVSLIGDHHMFPGAFVPPPPPGMAINFIPSAHYDDFLPPGYVPVPRYMDPRYARGKRNSSGGTATTSSVDTSTMTSADEATTATTVDGESAEHVPVQPEDGSLAPEPDDVATAPSVVVEAPAETHKRSQANEAAETADKSAVTSVPSADVNGNTNTNSMASVKQPEVPDTVPQCNAIDIAKIVSKLEQAAMEQQRIEANNGQANTAANNCSSKVQQQPLKRETRNNTEQKLDRRGVNRYTNNRRTPQQQQQQPQQQQEKKRTMEHGPRTNQTTGDAGQQQMETRQTEIDNNSVTSRETLQKTQAVCTRTTSTSDISASDTSVSKDLPIITSTTANTSVNYSEKLKATQRSPPVRKSAPSSTQITSKQQHPCPRLERTQVVRKTISYNRTESTDSNSTSRHVPDHAHVTRKPASYNRTESSDSNKAVRPVQITTVTSSDQWISVSSKKKRKGKQEPATSSSCTSPVANGAQEYDSEWSAVDVSIVEAEQKQLEEPMAGETVRDDTVLPGPVEQDVVLEPVAVVVELEAEATLATAQEDGEEKVVVESTTGTLPATPRKEENTPAKKSRSNKKQPIRKRIIINDEQITIHHQQHQQQLQQKQQQLDEEKKKERPVTPVTEQLTKLPDHNSAIVTQPQEPEPVTRIASPVADTLPVQTSNNTLSSEVSSDDARTVTSDDLSAVAMTTDSELTTASTAAPSATAPAVATVSKQKRKKKKTKASVPGKSAVDSTSDEWTLTADEDASVVTVDSDEGAKTNVEVSLEIDRMIQRGLFANLEEKLKSFNPSDTFIQSATLDTIKASSLDSGPKFGALGNFKNFDFSSILLNGIQQTRHQLHRPGVQSAAAPATAATNVAHQPPTKMSLTSPAGNESLDNSFTTTPMPPSLLINGCSDSILIGNGDNDHGDDDGDDDDEEEEKENSSTKQTVAIAAVSGTPTATKSVLDEDPPQLPPSVHVSRLPITRAVKEWMDRTRETTPEVEIFKRPDEIRPDLLVLASEASIDDDDMSELDGTRPHGRATSAQSREGSAAPDLLECWEDPSVPVDDCQDPLEQLQTVASNAGPIEQGQDALEIYESMYGKNVDYLSIQREVDECSRRGTATLTTGIGAPLPRNARDGGLPYRAICCTVM